MMMTLPYLLLEASCDKILIVADVFVREIFSLKYLPRGCVGDVSICRFFPTIFIKYLVGVCLGVDT